MSYTIELDTRGLVRTMTELESNQFPFAAMRALNEAATGFQSDQRAGMQRDFTIRRPWTLQGVKINREDFARKDKLEVRIHIDETRDFFNKFEPGGTRTPRSGRALAVPVDVRKAKTQVIPDSKKPKAFGFHEIGGRGLAETASRLSNRRLKHGVLRGGVRVYVGEQRTILIQNNSGTGVILQRVGRGKREGLRVLYRLKPATAVPASLHFHETARRSISARWAPAFTKWWNEAIRTMRRPDGAPIEQGQALPPGMRYFR